MSTIKTRKTVRHYVCEGEQEFQVAFQPVDHAEPVIRRLDDGRIVVGYLSLDIDCDNPLTDCDGMGRIHDRRSRHASRSEQRAFFEALGRDEYGEKVGEPNPYAVLLDVYEHSGEAWSVHGEGYNCQWDTTTGGGVWVPDNACREHIEYTACERLLDNGTRVAYESDGDKINVITYTLPDGTKKGGYKDFVTAIRKAALDQGILISGTAFQKKAHEIAVECARQALETFNEWLIGNCYGVCIEVFDADGEQIETDACWGYIGLKYAEEELRSTVAVQK
jgi:hypothetical protein